LSSQFREQGNAETGGNQSPDRFQFAAFASHARLESGCPARRHGAIPRAAFEKNEWFLRECAKIHPAPSTQGMLRGGEDDEAFLQQDSLIESSRWRRMLDDAHFHAAMLDGFGHGLRGAFRDQKLHLRTPLPEDRHGGRQQAGANGRYRADGQPPAAQTDHLPHCLTCGEGAIQQSLGMSTERFARGSQHAFTPPALEEGRPELVLQFADLLADRGLGEMQPGCCAGEIPLPRDLEKILQLVKFHRYFRSW
jgi:hypothetical protein